MIFIASKKFSEDYNYNKFKKYLKTNLNVKFLDNFCNLKDYNINNDNILIIDGLKVNNKGFLEHYDYFLEEFFITIPIDLLITNKITKKLIEICDYYKISILKF